MPSHFPTQLPVSGEMLRLISEVDRYLGQWSAMRQLAPERLASLRRIATIESVGSSTRNLFQAHDTLTLSQAAALLAANPHTLKRKFRELRDAGLIAAHGKGRGAFYRQ